jgi:endoglucanase
MFGARGAVAVVCLPLLVACGSAGSDGGGDTSSDPTQVPGASSNGGAGVNAGVANPERTPHLWRDPSGGSGGSASDPARGESTPPSGGPDATQPPRTETTPPSTRPIPYRGVNLSGAEFGGAIPGTFGTDYTFPTAAEVDYFMGKGMTAFRVPFRWERLQRAAYGALDEAYFGRLDALVQYATSKGASIILNPQNFARYYGATVGSSTVPDAVFADFWGKVAARYASNPRVMFNLVNEPHDMPTEQWIGAANAAIAAIRAAGAGNTIIVPGNGWTGGYSWYGNGYGTPNAVALLNITDPGNNVLFEAHQYFDADASGTSGQCMSASIGRERLAPWVKWLREHGKKGFLGEFAVANNPTCMAAAKDMLDYVNASSDVIVGWQWWGGGPWWGDYQFALDPSGGKDRPQMTLLEPYL